MSVYLGNQFIGNGNYLGSVNITDNNIFVPPPAIIPIDYLIIGGGGAAQAYDSNETCGGGGAGGFISGSTDFIVGISNPNIQVGYPGLRINGATVANGEGADGGASIFLGLTAYGGGGGGNSNQGSSVKTSPGRAGGSGGGGGAAQKTTAGSQTSAGGTGTSGQGFDGGQSYTAGSSGTWRAGSGGGAGGAATSGSLGASTPGLAKAWLDGFTYAGGGNGNNATPTNTSSGSGGTIVFNTTVGTEGKGGLVKLRYSGSTALFTGGTINISGGYVYHSFNMGTQPSFAPGTTTTYTLVYTAGVPTTTTTTTIAPQYWNVRQCGTTTPITQLGIQFNSVPLLVGYAVRPTQPGVTPAVALPGYENACYELVSTATSGTLCGIRAPAVNCAQSACTVLPTTTTTTAAP